MILLYFLVIGFQRMSKPLFATDQVRSPELIVKKREGPAWILEIAAPPTSQGQNQKDLDVAHDVSDLRKVYKYDALHNTLLVVVLLATVLNLRGITINFLWLITTLLVFAFIFSELPYAIGQYLLHERMLERYTGIEHLERKKKLEEYAPLFPPWALLAGLTTVASIGGFFFLLLNLFIQSGLLGK